MDKTIIKELRVNERIKAREVRLVGEKGEQLGIMPLYQAREVATQNNLDLVEVAATAVPPVCRLLDYGKYKYEQTKKEREARKGQKVSLLREVRLRPKVGVHDFDSMARSARKWRGGGKVRGGRMPGHQYEPKGDDYKRYNSSQRRCRSSCSLEEKKWYMF